MASNLTEAQAAIKQAVGKICAKYDDHYWLSTDESGKFPEEFVADIAAGGWLGMAMPERVGGAGLGLTEAALMMQTVAHSGAGFSGASAIHLNIFGLMPIVKFGTPEQQQRFLPPAIDRRATKLCFAVTEPNSGLDTSSLETQAERTNSGYRINGRKIWTTNAQRAEQDPAHRAHDAEGSRCKRPTDGPVAVLRRFHRKRIEAQADPENGPQGGRVQHAVHRQTSRSRKKR